MAGFYKGALSLLVVLIAVLVAVFHNVSESGKKKGFAALCNYLNKTPSDQMIATK